MTAPAVITPKILTQLRIAISFLSDAVYKRLHTVSARKTKDVLVKLLISIFALAAGLPLLLIFFYIFTKGISAIVPVELSGFIKDPIHAVNWSFFTHLPMPAGEAGGGIVNALIGSALLLLIASALSIPFGVFSGTYLSEFRNSKLAYWISLCVEVLQGIPSIVIGIIVYLWIVKPMRSFSLFAGAIALSIMMLPVIIKTTEETLKLVPANLKEASLALGAPYYVTILQIILPAGLSGIITGILLALARIAGETAPLLFTAFGNPYLSTSVTKPVESLPHLIFYYATSPYETWRTTAWGASLVLIVFVLVFNTFAKWVAGKWAPKFH